MIEALKQIVEFAGLAIEFFAVLVILFGFVRAATIYYRTAEDGARVTDYANAFVAFRHELGTHLLLGLEIMVVADVLESITITPTYQSLSILALLVLMRTALSWSTALQTEGRWPWQEGQENTVKERVDG